MTTERPRLTPGPDHPISLRRIDGEVTVSRGDSVIATTSAAVGLSESTYPECIYVPLAAVDPQALSISELHTYCPYKGDASYFNLTTGPEGDRADAVWYYPEPYEAVSGIRDHVAFYQDRVEISLS